MSTESPKNPRTPNTALSKALALSGHANPRTPAQGELDLQIEKEKIRDGVWMGVQTDGTPYMSGRGLARLCGVDSARISEIGIDWRADTPRPVTARVKQILDERGTPIPEHAYIVVKEPTGVTFHAYPDTVCLAVLEYYAFDAGATRQVAQNNFRQLAGAAMREMIYKEVGYDPKTTVPADWQQYHARVSRNHNSLPPGYFGVFHEIAPIFVTLGEAGLHTDSTFVPDISVGKAWGQHWKEQDFDTKIGPRRTWEHNYPDGFPQAASNPQHPWCYPDAALPEFRRWEKEDYIGGGLFQAYMKGKIGNRELPPSLAQPPKRLDEAS